MRNSGCVWAARFIFVKKQEDGVLFSMPVSDVLTFAVAAALIFRTYRELEKREDSVVY